MLFRKWGYLVGPENRIFQKLISVDRKKMALTTEIILHFHFHFKVFLERERERESKRARGRRPSSSPVRWSPANPELQSAPISRDRVVDRDLAFARSRRRSRSRIAVVGLELAKHRAVEPNRASIAISPLVELASRASIVDDFFSGFCPCFSGFVFSFFFSKHQKIFFGKFFEMQPNTWKHFPFRKIAFPKNGIFSGNAFTRTKHSLNSWRKLKTCKMLFSVSNF